MTDAVDGMRLERIDLNVGDAQLALVTLDRPDEMNPIDWELAKTLGEVFSELADDRQVRVVAITGAGRAFSAGGDMKKYETLQRDSVAFPQFLADFHATFGSISMNPKPFVALVNGIAVAGGIEVLLSCDLAIASDRAKIGDAHLPFGQMGGGGVLTLLPRAVGPARARELVLSGRLLGPEEACDWGLVSRVVPADELLAAGIEFSREVAKKSPLAVANAKQVMNAAWWEGTGVMAGLRLEREVTSRYCLTSKDAPEGLAAFVQKRSPQYSGS